MCQICAIKTLAARDRWPKPVEAHKKDLGFLIDTIHDEFETFKAKKMVSPKLMPPDSLLDVLRLLNAQLDRLEDDRKAWWSSPEKRAMRQRLELEGAQQKLSDLHKVGIDTFLDRRRAC